MPHLSPTPGARSRPALLLVAAALVAALSPGRASAQRAEISLDLTFGDGMVLQRDQPVRVRGSAAPGAPIEVRLAGDVAVATVGEDGRFTAVLPARPASVMPQTLEVKAGDERLVLDDVLVGEVWIAAGLDEMARSLDAAGVVPARGDGDELPDHVRIFVPRAAGYVDDVVWSAEERHRARSRYLDGTWSNLGAADARRTSSLAWHLAAELGRESLVPVGVVQLATGASTLESWVPRPRLLTNAALAPRLVGWWSSSAVPTAVQSRARRNLAGSFEGGAPPPDGGVHPFQPGFLWQHALLALGEGPVSGVVWAGGSFALEAPAEHDHLLRALIHAWRERVIGPDCPFVLVESSGSDVLADPKGEEAAQRRDLERRLTAGPGSLSNTVLVVTRDLALLRGGAAARSAETAARAVRLARALADDRFGLRYTGPMPAAFSIDPKAGEARVTFDDGHGLQTTDGLPLRDVWLVGADGVPRRATARIEGGDLVARHPSVRVPIELRYGWGAAWEGNLVNAAGLPVPTFRVTLPKSALVGVDRR